jgi:hypothetical protein
MVRWVLRRTISAFERQWDYDASYLREMIEASPRAAWRFLHAPFFARPAPAVRSVHTSPTKATIRVIPLKPLRKPECFSGALLVSCNSDLCNK